MRSPDVLMIVRWQVWVTFRQALASRLFWVVAGFTGLCVLLCLSIRITGSDPLPLGAGERRMRTTGEDVRRLGAEKVRSEGVDVADTKVSILFGAIDVPWPHYSDDAVGFLHFLLAGFIADTAGVMLALIWTAGFLPAFLAPGVASLFLAKPVPRWSLLLGKYLGVLGFVTLQVLAFVLGTWAALGLRTGVWTPHYLLCVPIVLFHFAIFFSVSTLLAVLTRNTVVCMLGSLGFWLFCFVTNNAWHSAQIAQGAAVSGLRGSFLQAGYWLLPKPADLNWLLADSLKAQNPFFPYKALEAQGLLQMDLSLVTSLAFAAAVLLLATVRFARTDY
jgi:ABC-type transport system involved in multi-copper enzyme maturation permease subunit